MWRLKKNSLPLHKFRHPRDLNTHPRHFVARGPRARLRASGRLETNRPWCDPRAMLTDSDCSDDYEAHDALVTDEGLSDSVFEGTRGKGYAIVEAKNVLPIRNALIDRAAELLGVTVEEAQAVLSHYSWNLENAATRWFENVAKARESSGLCDPNANATASGETIDALTCGICFDDFESHELTSAGCAHKFCSECWTGYAASKLSDGLSVVDTRCPMSKCSIKVSEDAMRRLLKDDELKKFEMFLMKAFVEQNDKFQPCVGLDCECAVSFESVPTDPVAVECTCGTCFCFTCQQEPHDPVHSCEVAKTWLDKVAAEGENVSWVLANTKPCPNCKRPILKNGGCMHMYCSQCHTSFCWLCLGPWDTKHYVCLKRCNRYKADKDSKQQRAQDARIRFVHYFERFKAHAAAGKKATDDVERFKSNMLLILMNLQRTSAQQVSFVMDALKQVARCRRILKWTYAFAYVELGDDKSKKEFFEYIQGDMEACLEKLSRMIESDIKPFLPPEPEPEDDKPPTPTPPKKQKKSVRKIPPPIIPKVEDYEYPQEEQERLEMEFAQYRAQVTDCTVVLGRSCNSLCNEMANDLLGTSKI